MRLKSHEIVLCNALDIELPLGKTIPVSTVCTGMGKIKAAVALVEHLLNSVESVKLVINLGSCGSRTYPPGMVLVERFSCWDHEFPEIEGMQEKVEYLANDTILSLGLPWPKVHCATGDAFVTTQEVAADCFDMEAYALAYVCHLYDIPFLSVKYVSDAGSTEQWVKSLPDIQRSIGKAFDTIMDCISARRPISMAERKRMYLQDLEIRKRIKASARV
jgi:adenosylhomocysteine nucleosidase